MKHIKKMKIDIDKKNFEIIPSVQYDSNTRFLHINLTNGSIPFDLTGCSVKISGTKQDGTAIFNNCTIISEKEGFVEVELTEQMNAVSGTLKCELKIYSANGVLTTKQFSIDITSSVTSKEITSGNEFKALTDALTEVQGIDNKFGEVYEHLDKKLNKDGIVTMANMGQDVKEAMTGGSVGVVGIQSTDIQNLKDELAFSLGEYKDVSNSYEIKEGYFHWYSKTFVDETGQGYSSRYIVIPCSYGDRFNLTGYSGGSDSIKRFMCAIDGSGNVVSKTNNYQITNHYYVVEKTVEKLIINFDVSKTFIIKKLFLTELTKKEEINILEEKLKSLQEINNDYVELTNWEKGYYSYSNGKFVASDGDRTMKIPCKKGDKFVFTGYKGGSDSIFKAVFEIDNNGNPTRTYYLPLYKMHVNKEYIIQGETTTYVVFDIDPRYKYSVKMYKSTSATNFVQKNKNIYFICWGDSLTAQAGWTTKLQEISGLTVFNGGTGGEDAETIASRQGADRIVVNNITIPSGNDQTVDQCDLNLNSEGLNTLLGNTVKPLRQSGQTHFNPCKIGNVEGDLYYSTGNLGTPHYYFVRKEQGNEVKITRPTLLKTNYDMNNNDGIMILFLGTNGSEKHFECPTKLIKLHKLMIQHSKCIDYVVLGMHVGDKETNKLYDEQMKYEFGERFINLREYLVNYGLEDSGLTATKEDNQAIAIGKCPPQLLLDGTHYTAKTKEIIGVYVYNKIKEIGII